MPRGWDGPRGDVGWIKGAASASRRFPSLLTKSHRIPGSGGCSRSAPSPRTSGMSNPRAEGTGQAQAAPDASGVTALPCPPPCWDTAGWPERIQHPDRSVSQLEYCVLDGISAPSWDITSQMLPPLRTGLNSALSPRCSLGSLWGLKSRFRSRGKTPWKALGPHGKLWDDVERDPCAVAGKGAGC